MRDLSLNVPSWAYQLGYRVFGTMGTYGDFEIWNGFDLLKRFDWNENPNIMELEEIFREIESEKAREES